MNNELIEEINALKNDKEVFKLYLKAFNDIEKVKETFKDKNEYKIIEEYLKKEDD